MGTSDVLYSGWLRILLITRSRPYSRARYKAGVQSQSIIIPSVCTANNRIRCTARSNKLDSDRHAVLCTREHTNILVDMLELGTLWESYGLVGNIVVRMVIIYLVFVFSDLRSQPFTEDFPRADIHEMLSPDILHQLIKGTFQDHLVTWVKDYLVSEHGERQANKILGDIDRR